MKLNLKLTLTAAALCLAVVFAACVNQTVDNRETGAELLSITVAGIEPDEIPRAIQSSTWDSEDSIYSEGYGIIEFNRQSDIVEARIRVTFSVGARAEWAIASRTTRPGPEEFSDTRVPATFEKDEFIYIRVTSQDEKTTNYYRFYATVFSWVTELNTISIPVRDKEGGHITDPETGEITAFRLARAQQDDKDQGGSTWDLAKAVPIEIANGEAVEVVVVPLTFDPLASVDYAVMSNDTTDPSDSFQPSANPLTFSDGDFLYVRVTAENTVDVKYYLFQVSVGHLTTLAVLKFGDERIYGLGLPDPDWDTAAPGDFAVSVFRLPDAGYAITIETDDPEATYKYVVTDSSGGIPLFEDPGNNAVFAQSGDILGIEITSQKTTDVMYYKVRVTHLPANIATQPKSAWYYRGAAVTPLTIVMDPPDEGQYTYTWYGADSWFGIYGRHGSNMDEKNNVSCVNGGPSMYFYLVDVPGTEGDRSGPTVYPGLEPPDNTGPGPYMRWLYGSDVQGSEEPWVWEVGTGDTFTPPNDWINVPVKILGSTGGTGNNQGTGNAKPARPTHTEYDGAPADWKVEESGPWPGSAPNHVNFLEGSTNENRYYWCVVKDANGLEIASDRAIIITETDPSVEHFIFELTDLPRRKNLVPFKEKNELHQIEIPDDFFPANFDPSKYDICIAIARYYLPDGRPWTQNWTHGDLHFGYTEGSASFIANSGPVTWWHNNMGANSGSIPLQSPHASQGGLGFPPNWIGFAPSGDDTRVPLMPRNDPITGELPRGKIPDDANGEKGIDAGGGKAQGYFAGFIELLEIRFQTPPVR